MLNKELLMLETELSSVSVRVTLEFYGGRQSGTDYTWTTPDGIVKTAGVFDERLDVVETFTCKPNTVVYIRTDNYSGNYRATSPQDITVETTSSTSLVFTAFRDVTVVF